MNKRQASILFSGVKQKAKINEYNTGIFTKVILGTAAIPRTGRKIILS